MLPASSTQKLTNDITVNYVCGRQQQLVQTENGCCKSLGHIYIQQGHT